MIRMPPAGAFDRIVTLQRAMVTQDAFNEEQETWAPLATDVPAHKAPLRDAERVRAAEVGTTVTDRFTIRWSPALSNLGGKDRLLCEGRTYNVTATKEIGRREGIEITATARP